MFNNLKESIGIRNEYFGKISRENGNYKKELREMENLLYWF